MENTIDTKHFKVKLEEEKVRLENELSKLGKQNFSIPGDWEVDAPEIDILASDKNEVADKIEEMEERSLILDQLENEYNEVLTALERIKTGQYGVCEVCNQPIATARLEAYPAAGTCIEHASK
jgi:RNA polymerase-binding transcription factor DksA